MSIFSRHRSSIYVAEIHIFMLTKPFTSSFLLSLQSLRRLHVSRATKHSSKGAAKSLLSLLMVQEKIPTSIFKRRVASLRARQISISQNIWETPFKLEIVQL